MKDQPIFRGFLHELSMENRLSVRERGGSFYPMLVRLQEARIHAGYSKERLASELGFHRTTILRYETGEIRTIDRDTLARWADLCNVPEKWLVDGGFSGNHKLDLDAIRAGCRMMGYPEPIPMPAVVITE